MCILCNVSNMIQGVHKCCFLCTIVQCEWHVTGCTQMLFRVYIVLCEWHETGCTEMLFPVYIVLCEWHETGCTQMLFPVYIVLCEWHETGCTQMLFPVYIVQCEWHETGCTLFTSVVSCAGRRLWCDEIRGCASSTNWLPLSRQGESHNIMHQIKFVFACWWQFVEKIPCYCIRVGRHTSIWNAVFTNHLQYCLSWKCIVICVNVNSRRKLDVFQILIRLCMRYIYIYIYICIYMYIYIYINYIIICAMLCISICSVYII